MKSGATAGNPQKVNDSLPSGASRRSKKPISHLTRSKNSSSVMIARQPLIHRKRHSWNTIDSPDRGLFGKSNNSVTFRSFVSRSMSARETETQNNI
jgi:hypothetical protein